MPGPARRRPSKAARQAPTRAVAALFGLIACVGMVGWYVTDNPQLVAGWVDGPAQTAPQPPEAPAPVAQAAAPAPVTPPARGADAATTPPDVERALTEAPPAAGPATVPAAATLPPDGIDGIDAGESVVPAPARPAAVPPVTAGATPAAPPAEAARTATAPGPDPADPAPRERRTATASAEADAAGTEGPARGNGRNRPVRPAEPVAAVEPAAPTSPRAICGTRANFALFRCMETQCGTGRWSRHPQCVLWRIENQ